jgi:hypothetical protein
MTTLLKFNLVKDILAKTKVITMVLLCIRIIHLIVHLKKKSKWAGLVS